MATSRSSAIAFCIAVALACTKTAGPSDASTTPAPAAQGPAAIDPVTPERDSVGPAPTRFEWTAIAGAEHYEIELLNDIDAEIFSHNDVRATALAMPEGLTLTPGTYFWRIGAVRGGRLVGDSGRSAFVVRE